MNMLQHPSNKGMSYPAMLVKYPTRGVNISCTKALDASSAPKEPLSFSRSSNFRCIGLRDTRFKSGVSISFENK